MTSPREYLVGPRYDVDDLTSGVDMTFKLEKSKAEIERWSSGGLIEIPEPVAGPIERRAKIDDDNKTWWFANCLHCGRLSKNYSRKNEPSLWSWARRHRCGSPLVTGDLYYKRSKPAHWRR